MTKTIHTLLNTSTASDFDTLINQHLPHTFPALSICVIYRGEIVLNQAWGWIDPENQRIPVTPSTRFDLASVTKLFVEATFLTLVNEGKVGLDSLVVDILPEFGSINPRIIDGGQDPHTREHLPIEEQYQGQSVDPTQVTFRHLLTHTSGLPPWRGIFYQVDDSPPPPPQSIKSIAPQRWQKALQAIYAYPFVGTIADRVRYSDIGIILLGEAVSQLHGSRLDIAVYERICQPLGLNSVTYNPVLNGITIEQIAPTEMDTLWRKRRAWGEVHDENACGVGGIAGHAGLFAIAEDVAKFGQAWLSSSEHLNISEELQKQAIQHHAGDQIRRGLGWLLKSKEDSSAGDLYSMSSYGHTGFTGTSLWVDPEKELVSAILTNRVYHGRDPEGIHTFRREIHDLIVKGVEHL